MSTRLLLPLVLGLTATGALAEDTSELAPLLSRLDQIRIPSKPFTATLDMTRLGRGGKNEVSSYRIFTRRVLRDGRPEFDSLLHCTAPAKDAGKLILFLGDDCWLNDPRAKRPTRIAPQQLWSQPVIADSLNWRLSKDFEARLAGNEALVCADGRERACRVLEFTPPREVKSAPALLRCWVDREGRPWKAMHLSASGKLFRTIEYLDYEPALGTERAAVMRISAGADTTEIRFRQMQAQESPPQYFELAALPTLELAER